MLAFVVKGSLGLCFRQTSLLSVQNLSDGYNGVEMGEDGRPSPQLCSAELLSSRSRNKDPANVFCFHIKN